MTFDEYKLNTKTINLTQIVKNIKELSERNNLNYNDIVKDNYTISPKEYNIPSIMGVARTKGLLKHKEVAVAIVNFETGTKLDPHLHEEIEIMKVLSGEMHLIVDKEPLHIIKANEVILVSAYTIHETFCPVKTEIVIITLPACATYPDGGV